METEKSKNESEGKLISNLRRTGFFTFIVCLACCIVIIEGDNLLNKNSDKDEIYYFPNSQTDSLADSSLTDQNADTENGTTAVTYNTTALNNGNTVKTTTKKTDKQSDETVVTTVTSVTETSAVECIVDAETETQTDTDDDAEIQVDFPLDLNFVTADELCLINGIGEKTAEKIINFRNSVGVITSFEQLSEIDGIGEKTIALLSEYLYISEDDYVAYSTTEETTQTTASSMQINETVPSTTTTTQKQTSATTVATYNESDRTLSNDSESVRENETAYRTVHINNADANEIAESLLLSDEISEKIVTLRELIGEFSSIDELELVDGLSTEKISAFKDYVIID